MTSSPKTGNSVNWAPPVLLHFQHWVGVATVQHWVVERTDLYSSADCSEQPENFLRIRWKWICCMHRQCIVLSRWDILLQLCGNIFHGTIILSCNHDKGQGDCGSLAGRNIAVWNVSVVLVFSHILHAGCRVSCGYLLVPLCETLPTCLLILLAPVLRHWSDQHLYNAERLEECVPPLLFPYLIYRNGSVSYNWFTYWMFSKISFGKKDNISEVHNVPSTVNVIDSILFSSLHEANSCCVH